MIFAIIFSFIYNLYLNQQLFQLATVFIHTNMLLLTQLFTQQYPNIIAIFGTTFTPKITQLINYKYLKRIRDQTVTHLLHITQLYIYINYTIIAVFASWFKLLIYHLFNYKIIEIFCTIFTLQIIQLFACKYLKRTPTETIAYGLQITQLFRYINYTIIAVYAACFKLVTYQLFNKLFSVIYFGLFA
eukprot:298645_1